MPVVESKGADLSDAAADDRKIGDLWEELSGGNGLFVMNTAQSPGLIDAKLPIALLAEPS